MGVSVLDCTLRDGGYINDWRFGEHDIPHIINGLSKAGMDIIEVGFLRDEPYNKDRTVFSDVGQITPLLPSKKESLYAAMVEISNPFPVELLALKEDSPLDIIRVIVWKEMLEESLDYCKAIMDKGYDVCVQPVRVNQYSDKEFVDMVELFGAIKPKALYIVDSWGTQHKEQIQYYGQMASDILPYDVVLGYHGHNNMQQTLSCAQAFLELDSTRDIWIDASVYGIGRGAGNLSSEIFVDYLNLEVPGSQYNVMPLLDIYAHYIKQLYVENPWGYSVPSFLTSLFDSNPEYAAYYDRGCQLNTKSISDILSSLSKAERTRFNPTTASNYIKRREYECNQYNGNFGLNA